MGWTDEGYVTDKCVASRGKDKTEVSQSPTYEIDRDRSGVGFKLVPENDQVVRCWLPTYGGEGWELKMSFAMIDGTRIRRHCCL